jgi:hypothetical protein
MRTSTFRSWLLTLLLLVVLTAPARADGGLLDLVRQTAAGNVPTPGDYGSFVLPRATGYATGTDAATWLRDTMNAASGWSYRAANGWQFATTDQVIAPAGGYAQRVYSYSKTPSNFAPGWAAYVGYAFWQQIGYLAPVLGSFIYLPAYEVNPCPTCPMAN